MKLGGQILRKIIETHREFVEFIVEYVPITELQFSSGDMYDRIFDICCGGAMNIHKYGVKAFSDSFDGFKSKFRKTTGEDYLNLSTTRKFVGRSINISVSFSVRDGLLRTFLNLTEDKNFLAYNFSSRGFDFTIDDDVRKFADIVARFFVGVNLLFGFYNE
jgi:hypothetical protein